MKKLTILFFLFFTALGSYAQEKLTKEEQARREKNIQAGNPFAKYGCKAPVATLSKGKYLEVHDLDSIVTIGTIRWHVDKHEIFDEIIIDSTDTDRQPTGDATGMWMSPDPLSEEFPSWSPYNMCLNNPIRLVDPDGKAPLPYNDDIITKVSNKKGDAHYVQRDVSIRMTLTVVNPNGTDLSKTMFNKSSGSIEFSSMTGSAQKDYRIIDVYNSDNLKNVSVDYRVVSSLKDVGKNDHVMMLVNNIPKTSAGVDPSGLAIEGGRVSAVEVGTIKNNTFNEAAQHEIGHNLGLDHRSGGLMNSSLNGSTATNSAERGEIIYNQLGPKVGNGTYTQSQNNINYNTRIQTQVNDFISKNNIKQ